MPYSGHATGLAPSRPVPAALELRKNGQIVGQMQIGQGDMLGAGPQDPGLGSLLNVLLCIRLRQCSEMIAQ